MTTQHFDSHDRAAVEASLRSWTKKLARERGQIGRLRARIIALQGKAAHARWVIARRRKQRDALPSVMPTEKVLSHALRHVGETESPAGSNRGPGIVSLCQRDIIGYDGVAWCGCFVGYHLRHFGNAQVTARVAYTPAIREDALARRNGFLRVVPSGQVRRGLVVLFDWNNDGIADHVGFVLRVVSPGVYETLEGNTSFDNRGSQSNGGCVAIKTRYQADVLCFVEAATS